MSTPPSSYPHLNPSIPYTSPPSRLRTLSIYLPRSLSASPPSETTWLIYVHGGAWRDPLQDSSGILPTIRHLESSTTAPDNKALSHIAGIASINYRLSPYPNHLSSPSDPADAERNVQHPSHVRDVYAALAFLRKKYGVRRWIGVGHSCGATMLLQLVAGIGLVAPEASSSSSLPPPPSPSSRPETQTQTAPDDVKLVEGPQALILLEGIYDISLLLTNHAPPACPEEISRIYRAFIAGAFGADEGDGVYARVSPVAGRFGEDVWVEGRVVLLGQSAGDELVEGAQREGMVERLVEEGWSGEKGKKRCVERRELTGGHDEIWEEGSQIATLIAEVVGRLYGK